jgi:NitT/TauT family transport system permease protein
MRRLFVALYDITLPKPITKYSCLIFIMAEILWWGFIAFALYHTADIIYRICAHHLTFEDFKTTMLLGFYTSIRVISLLFISSLIWVPIGIYIGLRPKLVKILQPLTQLLTAIPANLYYPFFVIGIINYHLNPNIWASGTIVMGSQWYIVYNVIGGAQTIPTELLEAAKVFRLNYRDLMLKIIIPAVLPFYVTGLITAAGASWNASILAEVITWGKDTITATGLGSYITINTNAGNIHNVALGVIVMVIFVIVINHIVWKPLYNYVSIKFRLE